MKTVRLSVSALVAAMAILSTSCATSTGMPSESNCAPCGPGMVCVGNGQCVPFGSVGNSGSGYGTDAGTPTGMGGAPGTGTPNPPAGSGSGGASGNGNGNPGASGGAGGASGSGSNQGADAGTQTGTGGGSGAGTPNPNPGTGGSSGGTNKSFCASCSSDADCGGGNNFCLAFSFGNYCGTDCGSGQSCPSGASCVQIGDGAGNVVGLNCIPSATDCSGTSTGGGTTGNGGSSGTGSGSCTTDTWSSFGSSFFQNYCNSCHGSQYASHASVQSQLGSISSSISSGNMPTGGLSSSMRSRILGYLNCGAP